MSRTNFVGVLITLMTFSAIARSEPLAKINQAHELEAKTQMIAIVRAQQVQMLYSNKFSSKISDLNADFDLNIPIETANYSYKTRAYYGSREDPFALLTATPKLPGLTRAYYGSRERPFAISTATPKLPGLKSYVGGSFLGLAGFTENSQEVTTLGIICESLQPSKNAPPPPTLVTVKATRHGKPDPTMLVGDRPQCASGSREVK